MTTADRHDRSQFSDAVRWALDDRHDAALASADWIARDIDAACTSAVALLADPRAPLERLVEAKDAFKAMRIVGETSSDRRMGGRLYAATIAAALVHHGQRISTQGVPALRRAFRALAEDSGAPEALREIATRAGEVLGGD